MDKKIKKVLLTICIEKQLEVIDALAAEINDAQRQANEYGAPKDRYDPYKTKLMHQRDMFAKQLAIANQVMKALRQVPANKEFNCVEFGALVIMESQNLFISAGLGKIDLNGNLYYAISPAVPIYKAMAGKKAGDEFIFNGKKFLINEIV